MGFFQGLIDIPNNIILVFHAHSKSNKRIGNSQLIPLFTCFVIVGNRCRVGDQGLHATEAGGNKTQFEAVEEPLGSGQAAFDIKGDHASEAGHLLFGYVMVTMAG